VSGGLTGGSLIDAQIAGVVGQNAVENNYLSDAQAVQEQKELKQCTNIGCTAKVKTQWAAINAAQQASFTAGIVVGLPAGAIEPIKELVHMATNPGETYEALRGLFTSGNILGNVSDAVKESYISRLNKLEEEYQRAGASGSYNAGVETGKLLIDMAALATGAGGAAKAGIKVTEKAIAKVANAAKKEVIEAGKGAGKGANIAKDSARKETTSTSSKAGEYLEGFKPSPTPAELVQQQAGQASKVTINTEHILNGEIKTYKDGTKVGTGGHYLRDPNIKVDKWTGATDSNGVSKGYISVRDPATGKWYKKQGETTFFPEHWSKRQTEMEIKSAFENSTPHPRYKERWQGTSSSGIKMEGYYKKPNGTGATAWPIYKGK
ncbi:EndoU domain-containing protein, partial [Snodgrassella alvi]